MLINFPYLTRDIEEKERQEKRECNFALSWEEGKRKIEQFYPCLIYVAQSQNTSTPTRFAKVLETPARPPNTQKPRTTSITRWR